MAKEITISCRRRLPLIISAKDIVGMVMDKPSQHLSIRSRCMEFEQKYGMG